MCVCVCVCGAAWECVERDESVCGAAWECVEQHGSVCVERHGSVCVEQHGSVCGAAWECVCVERHCMGVCVCGAAWECVRVGSSMGVCVERHGSVCVERHGIVCGAIRTELPWTRHNVHCLSSGRGPHRSVGLQAQVMGENGETRDT